MSAVIQEDPAARFRFVGCDAKGTGRAGRTGENPATFVKTRFDAGWQLLSVVDTTTDEVEGAIGPGPDPPYERDWWAADVG